MIHYRKYSFPPKKWDQGGFNVDGQKPHFEAQTLNELLDPVFVPPDPKLIWLLVQLDE